MGITFDDNKKSTSQSHINSNCQSQTSPSINNTINPLPKKTTLWTHLAVALLGLSVGLVLVVPNSQSKETMAHNKSQSDKEQAGIIIQPRILENSKKIAEFGNLIVWQEQSPEGTAYYPISTKDGKQVIVGTLLDGTDGSVLVDIDNGLDTLAQTQTQTDISNVQNDNIDEIVQESEKIPLPKRRWGGVYGTFNLNGFDKATSPYPTGGLPDDYFTKNMVGTGEVKGVGHQGAGVGKFKQDLSLSARHLAELISREAHHTGLNNKDVMENPQNYIWVFHKHDCVYCKRLITDIGTQKTNVVYVPLINSATNLMDDLGSSNVTKAFAELDGLYSPLALEGMEAENIKLKNNYTQDDLINLRYNTDMLTGIYTVMDEYGFEFEKDSQNMPIYATPTVFYFDRETGKPMLSYGVANPETRKAILGI